MENLTQKQKVHCTSCFKSLSVDSRMEIFRFLADKQKATVTEIVEHLGLTQPTVSYHLAEMRSSGILLADKKGKEVYYRVNKLCPHREEVCVVKNVSVENTGYVK